MKLQFAAYFTILTQLSLI